MRLTIPITQLPHGADLPLPAHATEGAAGVDLLAAVIDAVTLPPGGRAVVPTGLAIALPLGYEAQIRPRSGLAVRFGLTVLNSPGTIDADYRGELSVPLINLGEEPFVVTRGMRIAQMVVAQYARIDWQNAASLSETARGGGGFGSTGQ